MAVKYHTYVPKAGTPDAKAIEKIEVTDSGPSSMKGRIWLDEDSTMSWYNPYHAYRNSAESGVGEATALKVEAPTLHDGETVSNFTLKGDKLKPSDALTHLKQAGLVKNAELRHWNYRNPDAPEAQIPQRAHRHGRHRRPPAHHTPRAPDVPVEDTTPFWMAYINHGMDEQHSRVASVQFWVEPKEEAHPPRGLITFWGGKPGDMDRMVRTLNTASNAEGQPWVFVRIKDQNHKYFGDDIHEKGEVVHSVGERPQFVILFRASPNQIEPLTSDDMFDFLAKNKLVTSGEWRRHPMPEPTIATSVFHSPFDLSR